MMSKRMRAGGKVFLWVALLCCSWELQAAAQQAPSDYDELVALGVSAFEAGRYADARELLQRAHLLNPNARTLRGMGLAAFEARDYAQAGQDFERALAETQNPLDDAQREELERLQAEADARTARFRLVGQLPGSVLQVDGKPPLMDLAGFVLMAAGTHTVSLQLAGGEERTLALHAEGAQWSDLDLSAAQGPGSKNPWVLVAAPAPAPPKALQAPQLTAAAETRPPEPVAEAPESDDGWRDALVPALFGGSAIAAGFAIWQWAERESAVDDWNSDACLEDGGTRGENCADHKSAYESAQTWAWVAGGTALALSAAAVTLLLIQPDDATHEAAARCNAGVLALDCRVRF